MKKRILSLILALSMVLSVFPLGAFAAGSTGKLVIDESGYPVGSEGGSKDCNGGGNGNDWEYYSKSRILCLNGGEFNLSSTEPVECEISSAATITGGTFNGTVTNINGTISGGVFNGTVTNASTGKISGGTFAGSVDNQGTVTGGVFKDRTGLDAVENAYSIKWDDDYSSAYPNAKIEKVNDVSVDWLPYVCAGTTMTITANTEIFSLNGYPIGDGNCKSSYDGSDYKTVKFTMPGQPVALNQQITNGNGGNLVMEGGYPKISIGGRYSCSGNNWGYSNGTLHLWSGTFDFSNTNPQKTSEETQTEEPVKCAIQSSATIIGGIFNGTVENSGTIMKGTFDGEVTNYETIENGTFNEKVINLQIISNGIFKGTVTNVCPGTISGGTFAGSVENNWNIYGGVFNGNATLTNVTGGHNITWDAAYPNAKITEVNGVPADWKPYVYAGTTVTITANTEIYSLNGQPIEGSPYNSSYGNNGLDKTTVTFTMPGENVVLSTGELVMKDGLPDTADMTPQGGRYIGHNWGYDSSTKTLILMDEKFDFSSTHPQGKTPGTPTTTPVACAIKIEAGAEITGGIFEKEVTNEDGGTISGGTFEGNVTNINGNISNGTFNATVTNNDSGKITDGTFNGDVTNNVGTISGGTFQNGCSVTNNNTISGGTFQNTCSVENWGIITGNGTFEGSVTNYSDIEKGTFKGEVKNHNGTISGGKFEGTVINDVNGTISDGTFNKEVSNINGNISNGTFNETVTNDDGGTIYGGTFAGGVNNKNDRIYGGVFNGNATLTNVTGLHSITVASGAKIKKVNDVSAVWDPYVVVTESTKNQVVTITADTEIFSLNGRLLGTDDHVNGNKNTVKFTMPDGPVVLNGAITCTDLVMEKGWPEASNGGTISCSGTGWEYIKKSSGSTNTGTLYLMSGSEPFDFNFADPTTKITRTDAAVKCAIESYATISGGIFDGTVTNNAGGEISDGTFKGDVENSGYIEKGTFNGEVTNNTSGTIFGGTFRGQVDNNGKITGGIFAAGLSTTPGTVTGGIFNGNTGLTGAHQVTVTNGSVSTVNDEGPRNADGTWDLYSYAGTTVTITADTDIFSLNGQPIAESSYGVDKKTVTFTMPDDDVVLNGAITSTDLVMENGYPKDSNGGKNPCKGDGWEYIPNDPTNGDMLLLTGSNQTGGLFDFSTIGDGAAVECNVFVGKPTAITGGEFNGKVFNNSGILGGTFHGEVDNTTMGRIENGTFHGAVENNGIIENGTFHDEVKNNGTINDGTFNGAVENNGIINGGTFNGAVTGSGTVSESITGSGTLNGEPITKTPEPEPTTYTVTVIGGTIDGKTSVSAKENETLTVVLDQNDIPDGMTFDLWSISSSKLSGDINVDYRAEAMTFQMPAEDVTIRAQYRSAEIIEDAAPSPLATAATIAVGGAAAGIVVWQGVSLGVDLYLANALPQGVPAPTDRRALALLLWETAGKPEVALPTLYGDIPAEEIELQKATRWAVQNGLMDAADKKDASFFDPDHDVTKMDVFGAWLRLKKLLGTT